MKRSAVFFAFAAVFVCVALTQKDSTLQPLSAARKKAKPEREFFEAPPRKYIENLPSTKKPPALNKSAKTPAFAAPKAALPAWTALGPFPIPNGQTEGRVDPVSGRVTAIVVHPADANIVYVGTAQGGVYRSLNGGTQWTQLMDNAPAATVGTPLAIGSLAIDPQDASTLMVGTGEGNLSGDSFFGSGFYIITKADGITPTVNGPYNLRSGDGADIFAGRSIVGIAVDPTNHNNVFVATSSGVGGIVSSSYSTLPDRGLYRTTNAFAGVDATGTPAWTRLSVEATETNAITTAVVLDPSNPNILVTALFSQSGNNTTGGIYRTTNALAATPTFTKTKAMDDFVNVKLAINRVGSVTTLYATSSEDLNGNGEGQLYKSTNGGVSFGPAFDDVDGFATFQGFYDIAVAVDPTNANKVYIGGSTDAGIFIFSNNGGTDFFTSTDGLHSDVHAIAVAPSNSSVLYHGNDGGIWKSTDGGSNWTSLNNSTFSATQFQSLAVHPTDRYFSIGGTQDNGTEFLHPNNTFTRADFGDGGYSLIDQSTTSLIDVTMYHTYFNQTDNFYGTGRVLSSPCAVEGEWSFHGALGGSGLSGPYCDGSFDTDNGMDVSEDVDFYAPMALGPGIPNTWYFGSSRLYRSSDRADTATPVSQVLENTGTPISAIAVSPQDDNVRVVGLGDGRVFATTKGAATLQQIAGPGATNGTVNTPAAGVGRIAIDPNNKAIAYICFTGFGTSAAPIQHVWKTTNLDALNSACGVVTLTPVSSGLPDLPVNAIAIDPVTQVGTATNDIYIGTDAGVYYSNNAGGSWSVYGSGFPHVSVFGLEIQNPSRIVRAATHGRGLYEAPTVSTIAPTPTPMPIPAGTPPYGEILTPSPCTPLTSSTVTFTWSAGSSTAFLLQVGTTGPGSTNIVSSGQTGGLSWIVRNLPTDGRPVYVRLWSSANGIWFTPPQDYTYNAAAISVNPPVIAPATGKYKKKVTVNMATSTPGATIYYTVDGSTPSAASKKFTGPFTLTKTTTVRAIAAKTGVPNSPVVSAGYTISKK